MFDGAMSMENRRNWLQPTTNRSIECPGTQLVSIWDTGTTGALSDCPTFPPQDYPDR
jgi:hypothetical protein